MHLQRQNQQKNCLLPTAPTFPHETPYPNTSFGCQVAHCHSVSFHPAFHCTRVLHFVDTAIRDHALVVLGRRCRWIAVGCVQPRFRATRLLQPWTRIDSCAACLPSFLRVENREAQSDGNGLATNEAPANCWCFSGPISFLWRCSSCFHPTRIAT